LFHISTEAVSKWHMGVRGTASNWGTAELGNWGTEELKELRNWVAKERGERELRRWGT
jgi:hypothetical protein